MVARYEHLRWVVLKQDAVLADNQEVPMFSPPILMNAHDWRKQREVGYEVYVLPYGGTTRCRLYEPATEEGEPDELLAISEVVCSEGDNYVKAMGRVKAHGRAISALKQNELVAP